MSLPKLDQQPDMAPFRDLLTTLFPGGEYALPHLEDGPYYIVYVSKCEAFYGAERALQAYPARVKLDGQEFGDRVPATVHVVPQFTYRFLQWEQREHQFELLNEATSGPFETEPTDRDIAAAFTPALLDGKGDECLAEVLSEACDRVGLRGLARLLNALPDEVRDDEVSTIATTVAGITATAPQTDHGQ